MALGDAEADAEELADGDAAADDDAAELAGAAFGADESEQPLRSTAASVTAATEDAFETARRVEKVMRFPWR